MPAKEQENMKSSRARHGVHTVQESDLGIWLAVVVSKSLTTSIQPLCIPK